MGLIKIKIIIIKVKVKIIKRRDKELKRFIIINNEIIKSEIWKSIARQDKNKRRISKIE